MRKVAHVSQLARACLLVVAAHRRFILHVQVLVRVFGLVKLLGSSVWFRLPFFLVGINCLLLFSLLKVIFLLSRLRHGLLLLDHGAQLAERHCAFHVGREIQGHQRGRLRPNVARQWHAREGWRLLIVLSGECEARRALRKTLIYLDSVAIVLGRRAGVEVLGLLLVY